MKKLLSLLVVIALLAGLSVNAFASSAGTAMRDVLVLQYDGHGQFTRKSASRNASTIDLLTSEAIGTLSIGNTVSILANDDEEIYAISSAKYLVKTYGNIYMLADKIEVNIKDISINTAAFEKYQIADDMIREIRETIAEQNANGNENFSIAILAPGILRETTAGALGGSRAQTTEVSYYTWNGYQMQDTLLINTNSSTGMVDCNGTSAKDNASAFTSFLISAAGVTNVIIGVFSAGMSALEAYEEIHGTVVQGAQSDRFYANIIYNKIQKSTRVYGNDSWLLGCISYMVWLNRADVYQYYCETGEGELLQPSINQNYFSEHYQSPEQTAVAYAFYDQAYLDGSIRINVFNTNIVL